MYLIDLHIDGFGKFHNLDLRFADGMNILYGRNEAGKSTLHAFLQAMLYGLERRPGVGSAARLHKNYRPWDTPDQFGGQLRLQHEGKVYRIVRNFAADDLSAEAPTSTAMGNDISMAPMGSAASMQTDTISTQNAGRSIGPSIQTSGAAPLEIWNESDEIRIADPKAFLQVLLGGISETAFENTVSIGQLRSATSRSMVRELKSYITNLSTTGDMSLDSAGALQLLKQQRTALEAKRVPEAAKSYAQLIGEIRA